MALSRHADGVTGTKRPLSPEFNPPATKRIRTESLWRTPVQNENENELDSRGSIECGLRTWQSRRICDFSIRCYKSQTSHDYLEHEDEEKDVKYDPAYLDAQYESQLVGNSIVESVEGRELHQHDDLVVQAHSKLPELLSRFPESPTQTESSPVWVPTSPWLYPPSPIYLPGSPTLYRLSPSPFTLPPPSPLTLPSPFLMSVSSYRHPASPSYFPASPREYESTPSPSPSRLLAHRQHTPISPFKLVNLDNSSSIPPSPPRLELLSSPGGPTPLPLFSPQPSPRINTPRTIHLQVLGSILGNNEFGDPNNIIPSPADDMFNTTPSQQQK